MVTACGDDDDSSGGPADFDAISWPGGFAAQVQDRILSMARSGDCPGLQGEFAQADENNGLAGRSTTELMSYIDAVMREAGCFSEDGPNAAPAGDVSEDGFVGESGFDDEGRAWTYSDAYDHFDRWWNDNHLLECLDIFDEPTPEATAKFDVAIADLEAETVRYADEYNMGTDAELQAELRDIVFTAWIDNCSHFVPDAQAPHQAHYEASRARLGLPPR